MKWYKHRYFLLFILLFSYIKSVYQRILVWQEVNMNSLAPDGALGNMLEVGILFLVLLYFLKKWGAERPWVLVRILLVSLFTYLVIIQSIGFVIALLFDNVQRNFNGPTFFLSTTSYLLNGIIYGSFLVGYVYYRSSLQQQALTHAAVQAQANLRIAQLRAQLNPHFLFNNLNVLDQLIEVDREKASEFLHRLADIYRYVLQLSERALVPLREELQFVQHYFSLVQTKYGSAYTLEIKGDTERGKVVPLSVQLLLENAVQHNVGTATEPVNIAIQVGAAVVISNNKSPRKNIRASSGTGLNNLELQYRMLSKTPVEKEETETSFTVKIPLIDSQ